VTSFAIVSIKSAKRAGRFLFFRQYIGKISTDDTCGLPLMTAATIVAMGSEMLTRLCLKTSQDGTSTTDPKLVNNGQGAKMASLNPRPATASQAARARLASRNLRQDPLDSVAASLRQFSRPTLLLCRRGPIPPRAQEHAPPYPIGIVLRWVGLFGPLTLRLSYSAAGPARTPSVATPCRKFRRHSCSSLLLCGSGHGSAPRQHLLPRSALAFGCLATVLPASPKANP